MTVKICKRGHPRTPENIDGQRHCKLCERERKQDPFYQRRQRERKREQYWSDPECRERKLEARLIRYNRMANDKDRNAIAALVRANPWVADFPELRKYVSGPEDA